MGEFLALELLMVSNGNVGDLEQVLAKTGAGVVVEGFTPAAPKKTLEALDRKQFDMSKWRERARHWFVLQRGVDSYDSIYRTLA